MQHPENQTPDPRSQQARLDRLIHLTRQGLVQWSSVWEAYDEDDTLGQPPTTYGAHDYQHGFGPVQLSSTDPLNESDDPALNVSGEPFTAVKASDLRLLVDTVTAQMQDIQAGVLLPEDDRIQQASQRFAAPFELTAGRLHGHIDEVTRVAQTNGNTIDKALDLGLNLSNVMAMMMQHAGRIYQPPTAIAPEAKDASLQITGGVPEELTVAVDDIDRELVVAVMRAFERVVHNTDVDEAALLGAYGEDALDAIATAAMYYLTHG